MAASKIKVNKDDKNKLASNYFNEAFAFNTNFKDLNYEDFKSLNNNHLASNINMSNLVDITTLCGDEGADLETSIGLH